MSVKAVKFCSLTIICKSCIGSPEVVLEIIPFKVAFLERCPLLLLPILNVSIREGLSESALVARMGKSVISGSRSQYQWSPVVNPVESLRKRVIDNCVFCQDNHIILKHIKVNFYFFQNIFNYGLNSHRFIIT